MQITRVLTINLTRGLTSEQQIILDHLTYSASKLWNVANYEVTQGNMKITELERNLKATFWYKNLHSQSAQAVLQKLKIAWVNFFKHYTKRPRYQPKDGHFPVKWKKDGFKIVGNMLRLSLSRQTKQYLRVTHGIESAFLWIGLPKALSLDAVQVKEIEIAPHDIYGQRFYVLHIIYRRDIAVIMKTKERVMAIDLGIKNLATVVIEGEKNSIIFDGRILVSRLRWGAKKTAKLKSVLAKQGLKNNKHMAALVVKERNYVKDYLHKISRWVVEVAKEKGVTVIVIGDLTSNFSDINIGRRNNEKFHRIPFGRLITMIAYKAEEAGITVKKINESYTSQTCSVCGMVKKSNRKYRGLYVCSSCGAVLNADVNGARNIMFRVVPNPESERGRDSGFGSPWRATVFNAPRVLNTIGMLS